MLKTASTCRLFDDPKSGFDRDASKLGSYSLPADISFFIKPENVSFLTDHLMAPIPRFGEFSSVFDASHGNVKVIFGYSLRITNQHLRVNSGGLDGSHRIRIKI